MKNIKIKQIIQLQLIVIIYTIAGIMAKFASWQESIVAMGIFFLLDLGLLGIYAILWQQMIKVFPLSIAYANRAMALLWSAIWAKIIFGEKLTLKQLVAIMLVIVGTILVNGEEKKNGE